MGRRIAVFGPNLPAITTTSSIDPALSFGSDCLRMSVLFIGNSRGSPAVFATFEYVTEVDPERLSGLAECST